MDSQYFANTVKNLYGVLRFIERGLADASDIDRWISITSSAIEELENRLTRQLVRPLKQKYETSLRHLISIRGELEHALKKGGELQRVDLPKERVRWDDMQSAFKKRINSGVISNLEHLDTVSFLDEARNLFQTKIADALKTHNTLKVNSELSDEFIIQKSDSETAEVKYFNTENASIHKFTDLQDWFDVNVKQPIQQDIEEFQEKDSGWSLRRILHLTINVNALNPMQGSSYISLPPPIQRREACINVQNFKDEECFKWAILSALHPTEKNANRVSKYKQFENELNFSGIDFPVSPFQIAKFERQNPVSINLYILKLINNDFTVSPCYLTSSRKEKHVHLLLVQDKYTDEQNDNIERTNEDDTPPKFHYVWIKNLSALLHAQTNKRKRKIYICDRCLHYFYSDEQLKKHEVDCTLLNKCKILLPSKRDKILKFSNFDRKERVPFVIYADFECLLKPVEEKEGERAFQQHQAYSIGYYVKCSFDDTLSTYESYRQEVENKDTKVLTPAEWFVGKLKLLVEKLENLFKNPVPLNLSHSEKIDFQRATTCHICGKPFSNEQKVRDHCHLTGK